MPRAGTGTNSETDRESIERLRDAGLGSPYEGATEMTIAHTYDAAGKAGCIV